jgi:RimJ/RimL family protein N-acetyltransferase
MGPPMIVRELKWGDFDGLLETYYHLYDERAAGEPIGISLFGERPTLADEVTWFANLFRRSIDRELIVVVAEEDGRPVGSCTIQPISPRRDGELGHVGELGILVDHRYRDRGVGRALMVRALEQARGEFEIVRLGVFADNTRAIELYRRLGFVLYGRLPCGIRRGERYIDEEFMYLSTAGWEPPATPNR